MLAGWQANRIVDIHGEMQRLTAALLALGSVADAEVRAGRMTPEVAAAAMGRALLGVCGAGACCEDGCPRSRPAVPRRLKR